MNLNAFENKQMVLGICIDLTKAFDHINEDILLRKLEAYGVRGASASFINSYLEHRQQCLAHNSLFSTTQNISTGVPQGSILGPLLFIAYINEVFNIFKRASLITYVDATI